MTRRYLMRVHIVYDADGDETLLTGLTVGLRSYLDNGGVIKLAGGIEDAVHMGALSTAWIESLIDHHEQHVSD